LWENLRVVDESNVQQPPADGGDLTAATRGDPPNSPSGVPRATVISTAVRFVVAVGVLIVGASSYPTGRHLGQDRALPVALLVFGGFALVHTVGDLIFAEATHGQGTTDAQASVTDGVRVLVGACIATPATVLGLVNVFAQQVTTALRWGEVLLVVGILLAIMLMTYVIFPLKDSVAVLTFVSFWLILTLWALALGLTCIGFSLVYR
jgi:hypothetical protein